MRASIQALRQDESGLTTVEYALLLCFIAIAAVGAWQFLGGHSRGSVSSSVDTVAAGMEH